MEITFIPFLKTFLKIWKRHIGEEKISEFYVESNEAH
jgi:hypothetical protein